VASLAAGNGLSSGGRFTGMAPEAELVVARVTGATVAIDDTDVLKAVELIYWLGGEYAESIGEPTHPTVVNMSLGSDFGPHDGRSVLGEGLAQMVGAEYPGRALVLAAGNSAGLLYGFENFPEPLGVHTEVDVPHGSSVRVPLVTPFPRNGASTTNASVFVWIDFMPGDDLAIGFEGPDGSLLSQVPFGQGRVARHDQMDVAVINGTTETEEPTTDSHSAVILLEGRWRAGTTFAVRLTGHGTASFWAQSEGDLAPEASSIGALFPRASKASTINIPAAHPDLIAVGATVNRLEWSNRAGDVVGVADPDAETQLGSVAYFSSAGPTFGGVIKPDLVAPGEFVIGAMAKQADPATNRFSIFAGGSGCDGDRECAVVDDEHGVISGTSMASPIIAGAAALLLEQDPTLTQSEVRALLQAGSKVPKGTNSARQVGAGALDLAMTRRVLDARTRSVDRPPARENSRLVIADDYARPDSDARLDALLVLRDETGGVADGFDESLLRVTVEHGSVAAPIERAAPGLWRFGVSAGDHAGGRSLVVSVRYDGALLASVTLPIAADAAVAQSGFAAHGGCAVVPGRVRTSTWEWLVAFAIVVVTGSRRRASRVDGSLTSS
jgi:subtilisin family serine protease